jgi:hypothetical protein
MFQKLSYNYHHHSRQHVFQFGNKLQLVNLSYNFHHPKEHDIAIQKTLLQREHILTLIETLVRMEKGVVHQRKTSAQRRRSEGTSIRQAIILAVKLCIIHSRPFQSRTEQFWSKQIY